MSESTEKELKSENPDKRIYADIRTTSDDEVAHVLVRDKHELTIDEPWWATIGNDSAPCPGDYLIVATAGCQVEVLKQCFEKARIGEYKIAISSEYEREDPGDAPEPFPEHTSIRVSKIFMELTVETTPEFEDRVRRCLTVCEDACIISRSVETGIDFDIKKSLEVTDG